MSRIDDRLFNAALREALRESYEEDFQDFLYPKKRHVKKYIFIAAAVIVILTAIALPVWGIYLRFRVVNQKDYIKILISDNEEHSETVDSLEIGYIPNGWERKQLAKSQGQIFEIIENDESYVIIHKVAFYDGLDANIDDSYGKPEIKNRNGISYFIYSEDEYNIVIFLNDYIYTVESYNVKKSELNKIIYSIK